MKKVWIYQANRFFTEAEEAKALSVLQQFVAGWTAHGDQLAGKAHIYHHLFIVLEVDESVASTTGCSVDKSVHLLKKLEQELNIGLFDRLMVAYRDAAGVVQLVSRNEFAQLVKAGEIASNTIVFNNLLASGEEFPDQWEVPFQQSWHAKAFVI
ncbi:ABC transporter ATPase [Sphingobacterium corticibacter]|uniref:ABC transporter ATPase n=1 Tax=Sphingobacterium corticibacter TaxID=2171749 RepID=A0A2T8HJA2_9SPHI|nr:ABC transporter ATPase [Sphingobacterium corticibacter]PVH25519.1 ABC transporter ATPase [Sphingobacterium corticibacter]